MPLTASHNCVHEQQRPIQAEPTVPAGGPVQLATPALALERRDEKSSAYAEMKKIHDIPRSREQNARSGPRRWRVLVRP
jgi:hypothetical protein